VNDAARQGVAYDSGCGERPDQASERKTSCYISDRPSMLAKNAPALSLVDPLQQAVYAGGIAQQDYRLANDRAQISGT